MFVSVNGVRLFFDVVGEKLHIEGAGLRERPALICLHGGPGGDHQSLRPDFDRFASRCQVVYFDQRGGGRSEHGPESGWTLDQWADDVAAFCDALGVVKPIIIGVSGGAIVTANYLARHPGHARAGILVNACARLDRDEMIAGFGRLGGPAASDAARNMYLRGTAEDFPAFMQHCLPHYARRPAPPMTGLGRTSINFAVSRHFFTTGAEGFRFDLRGKIKAVTCPVLALAGKHDPVTRPEWGRELADAMTPGLCEFVLYDEASHAVANDVGEPFYAAVEAFIDRV